MAYMIWKQEYNVNIKDIDSQHRRMFEIINQLEHSICNGQGIAILKSVFNQMSNYAMDHFSTEEEYFKKCSYEHKDEHIAEHDSFKDKLKEFEESLEKNKDVNVYVRYLSTEVMKFLKQWWIHHICFSDKKYEKTLHECGIS